MTFQPGANLYGVGVGTRPENVEVPFLSNRAPTTTDTMYPIGKRWVYIGNSEWVLLGQTSTQGTLASTWAQVTSSSGDVQTVLGTANQVTATTVGSTATMSLPNAIITPGTLTTTGNLTVGTAPGAKVLVPTGTNASIGTSAAMTAGTIVVNTTAVTASSIIFVSHNTIAGTAGAVSAPSASRVAGTSFTITSSSNTDTSTVNWWIIN